jgi:hypothetical protein
MTSQSPRIYIYKITFEEVQYYYYGIHREKKFNEEYWGSPKTHKWCWDFYTPKKQILEFFEFSDEGWLEAYEVEKRLIAPVLNDVWCLNENVGGIISLEMSRKGGEITKELGIGIHGLTQKQRRENSKKAGKIGGKIGGKRTKELGIGIHARTKEQIIEDGKIGGKKAKELGVGVHRRAKEQMTEDGKKGAKKAKELGVGIFGLPPEQLGENGRKGSKKTNAQKWECTETGFIANPGNLTQYQRARGIDTSKRIKIL